MNVFRRLISYKKSMIIDFRITDVCILLFIFATMRRMYLMSFLLLIPIYIYAQMTLEDCQQAAAENHPLIKRYDLLRRMADHETADIRKGWLPQLTAVAQATIQNRATSLPSDLAERVKTMGWEVSGLKKEQYRVGVDVNQTIYDGGVMRERQRAARLDSRVKEVKTDAELYAIRRKVNELFFGILLIEEQLRLNGERQAMLSSHLKRLEDMQHNGVATPSDVDRMRIECLLATQQAAELNTEGRSLRHMLALFCGRDSIGRLVKPPLPSAADRTSATASVSATFFSTYIHPRLHPEMQIFEARLALADARERLLKSLIRPRLSAIGQAFYGYPGFDMLRDIRRGEGSFNALVGLQLSWSIGNLYRYRNNRAQIATDRLAIANERDLFLFNNRLEQVKDRTQIEKYYRLMDDDEQVIRLRASVRKAAEAKLQHGVIDVSTLVTEINHEHAALITKAIHETELLRYIYDFIHTTHSSIP